MTRMTSDIESLTAAVPGRPRQPGRAGPHARRRHRRSCSSLNVDAGRSSPCSSSCRPWSCSTLWFRRGVRPGLRRGARPHRRRAGRPRRRACPASGSSPPTTGAATTSSTTATSSATTATPTSTRRRVGAIYGPGTEVDRRRRPGAGPARRREHGARRRAHASASSPRSCSTSPRSSPRSSSSCSSTTPTSRARPRCASCATCSPPSPTVRRARRRRRAAADRGRDRARGRHVRLRARPAGAARRRPRTSRRARRSRSSAPTGAGKSTIAKLVTRFYDPTPGAVLHRRPRPARRHARVAAPPARRRAPGAVPVRTASIRDNIAFARPDATDDEVLEACRAVGLDDLIERLPDGLDTPVPRAGRVAVVGRAPAAGAGPRLPRPAAGARARRGHVEPRPARPRRRSSTRSTCCSRAAPRSSSPTGWPPPCGPTASPSSTTAASSSSAPTTSSSPAAAATPPCTPRGSATPPAPLQPVRHRCLPDGSWSNEPGAAKIADGRMSPRSTWRIATSTRRRFERRLCVHRRLRRPRPLHRVRLWSATSPPSNWSADLVLDISGVGFLDSSGSASSSARSKLPARPRSSCSLTQARGARGHRAHREC